MKRDEKTEEAATANETMQNALKNREQALEQKAREVEEAAKRYLQIYADYEAYRKRAGLKESELRKYANEQLGQEVLTILDSMALAIKEGPEYALRESIAIMHKNLLGILERFGIRPFSSEGERFDPEKHKVIIREERDDLPENSVVRVIEDGYCYHDRVLRPAKVVVAIKAQARAA